MNKHEQADDHCGSLQAVSVRQVIEARGAQAAGAALIEGRSGRTRTWAQVGRQLTAWDDASHEWDWGHGRVGLLFEDPLAAATMYLTALAAGVTIAPLNPAGAGAEIANQARALGLTAVLTDRAPDGPTAELAAAGADVFTVHAGAPELAQRRLTPAPPVGPPGGWALIMTSSGTTGEPKIVPLREGQLLQAANAVVAHHQLTRSDRGYCPLPLFHINALVVGVLSTALAGGSLVVDRRFSRRRFWATIRRHDVTWANLVPAIIAVLADTPADHPAAAQLRFVRSASSALSPATQAKFERHCHVGVLETYGMTEAASQITANPIESGRRRPASVGLPVGVELRITDSHGTSLRAGSLGCVEIRGDTVIRDYLAPAGIFPASRPAVSDSGWLRTGDLGRVDDDGFLYLAGRVDDVINRGGEKIYPREIEDVLLTDGRVQAAVVVGRHHEVLGEEPVAFVLASIDRSQRAELAAELSARCDDALSLYKRPAMITVAESLPAGSTGKVRRAELRESLALQSQRPYGPVPTPAYSPPRPSPVGSHGLDLPFRAAKPRRSGLTMVIDGGLPHGYFADAVSSAAAHIDIVKFGWGTCLVTDELSRKVELLHANNIRFFFGGTLFEKFVLQDRFDQFLELCRRCRVDLVEISNGTIPLSNTEKAAYIRECTDEFAVVSEVGFKDSARSDSLSSSRWVDAIQEDLDAGATLVITEARESGRSGLCKSNGDLRTDVLDDILASGVDAAALLFEAPTKSLQTEFVTRLGSNVNLGNITPTDVIALETLRLGLRSDTLLRFEAAAAHA